MPVLIGGLLITGCAYTDKTAAIDAACTQAIHAYALTRDNPARSEDYAALFTPDGIFDANGTVHAGRAAIVAYHTSANERAKTAHNVTSVMVRNEAGTITAESYALVAFGEANSGALAPIIRTAIGRYEDEMVMKGGRCFLQKRRLTIPFLQRQ